ncbi:hypothetical protein DM01DRAFT_1403424 [Hesseltinella vesiculosa]|uniref:Ubiquitin-like domain-containing protein n=1 Tax=Hesseltinella vesiculosa TaxID=101127 RepID=A0A1X2GY67_9FUNG|nr:hypothetical protein DM01DRAFT_1403424 [Hesseltinella vesiculosa]
MTDEQQTRNEEVLIGLQIKTMEQPTQSVTLPRNSSVLELKNVIQTILDVECGRQRLIFQGKVLKDDKNLMDYANLEDGKVVHLVIRPLDAPHNPLNDEPANQRRTFRQRSAGGQPFGLPNRMPMMEGITFITLDAHIGGSGADHPSIASLLQGLTSANLVPSATSTQRTAATNATPSLNSASSLFPGLFNRTFERRRSQESTNVNTAVNNANDANNPSTNSSTSPHSRFPQSSVEMRLSRTIAYIRNVRNILNAPADQQMSQIPYTSASSADFIQEIRGMLRGDGHSQSHQVGMVMNELADLMEQGAPWLRETAQELQSSVQDVSDNTNLFRRVLRAARIVQGMSLIHHFLGSVLASADMDGRRSQSNQDANFVLSSLAPWTSSTTTTTSTATATSTPASEPARTTRRSSSSNRTETLALPLDSASSSSQPATRGSKRRASSSKPSDSAKRHQKGKQKESKDKTD